MTERARAKPDYYCDTCHRMIAGRLVVRGHHTVYRYDKEARTIQQIDHDVRPLPEEPEEASA